MGEPGCSVPAGLRPARRPEGRRGRGHEEHRNRSRNAGTRGPWLFSPRRWRAKGRAGNPDGIAPDHRCGPENADDMQTGNLPPRLTWAFANVQKDRNQSMGLHPSLVVLTSELRITLRNHRLGRQVTTRGWGEMRSQERA